MSLKHFWYQNVDGDSSFLCGAVSVVCEYFNAELMNKKIGLIIESDVFYIGTLNEIPLESAIKSRFVKYMQNTNADDPKDFNASIDGLSLDLINCKSSLENSLAAIFKDMEISKEAIGSQILDFCASVCHFFSKPISVCSVDNESFINNKLIKKYYLSRAEKILVVEFASFALMLVIGYDN